MTDIEKLLIMIFGRELEVHKSGLGSHLYTIDVHTSIFLSFCGRITCRTNKDDDIYNIMEHPAEAIRKLITDNALKPRVELL